MASAIETSELVKSYGGSRVVGPVSFSVGRGSTFGYLGPNGAGKTTTIRMILGLIRPESGWISICGVDPFRDRRRAFKSVGYAPEIPNFQGFFTGEELLDFIGRVYGLSGQARRERVSMLFELVGLSDHAGKKIGKYSKGMVQRLSIAQALINDPEVLVMDEPTIGMDPAATIFFRDLFKSLRSDGKTIFISSHILDEVQRICSHVAMIHRGRIIFSGALSDILNMFTDNWVVDVELEGLKSEVVSAVEGLGFIREVRVDGNRLSIILAEQRDVRPEIAEEIVKSGGRLLSLNLRRVNLEEAYIEALRKG